MIQDVAIVLFPIALFFLAWAIVISISFYRMWTFWRNKADELEAGKMGFTEEASKLFDEKLDLQIKYDCLFQENVRLGKRLDNIKRIAEEVSE